LSTREDSPDPPDPRDHPVPSVPPERGARWPWRMSQRSWSSGTYWMQPRRMT